MPKGEQKSNKEKKKPKKDKPKETGAKSPFGSGQGAAAKEPKHKS